MSKISRHESIYSALIQPSFDYRSPFWDTCNKTLKDNSQRFQNRAARITASAGYEIRSADVLQSLEWDNLESRRKLTKAAHVCKILNDHSSPNLKEFLIKRNISQTTYDPRNAQNDLAVPKPRRDFLKKSFRCSGAKLWNDLPGETKETLSICSF